MSFLNRTLTALPLLLLPPLILRAISFAEPSLSQHLEIIRAASSHTVNDQSFTLRNTFFRVPVIDEIFATCTSAFSLVHLFPEDHGAYWQAFVFLTEFAGVYALFLFEACKGVNQGRVFAFPNILLFFGQIIPVGFVAPIWLFFYVIFTPKAKLQQPGSIGISPAHAAAVLPTIILGYYIPHFTAFLHQDLSARHWWMWVWQLYPIWCAAFFFLISQILAPIVNGVPSRKIVQVTLVALSMVNAAAHWYTDFNSDLSFSEIFIPRYLFEAPDDAVVVMKTILQYDHLCVFAGTIMWLLYSLGESTSSGKGRTICILAMLGLFGTFGVVSLGTFTLIAWELKERLMVADLEAEILKGVGDKKQK